MKIKILLGNWKILFNQDINGGSCYLLDREIHLQSFIDRSKDFTLRIIKHEVVHALLSELGQSQNQAENGSRKDSFDSEFICEFISIYNDYIKELSDKIYNKVTSIK